MKTAAVRARAVATDTPAAAPLREVWPAAPAGTGPQELPFDFGRIGVAHGLQTKLRISAPGDEDEREADRIADALVTTHSAPQPRAHADGVQRACCSTCSGCGERESEDEETPLHRSATSHTAPDASPGFEPILSGLRGRGEPLPHPERQFFESRMQHDFGSVRVHHDASAAGIARRLSARAFTVGNDIAFADGEYSPRGIDGLRLLGHELTHVVQQRRAGPALRRKLAEGQPQNGVTLPETHIEVDKGSGTAHVYVDGVLILDAQFPAASAGGVKIETTVDAAGKLKIAVAVIPGSTFTVNDSGLRQLSSKYPVIDFGATTLVPLVEQLPQPEQIIIFKQDPELSLPRLPQSESIPIPEPKREPEPVPEESLWDSVGEWVHGALDIAGVIPGLGEIADGINAVIYVAEGRYAEAAISAAAMIPIVGDIGKIGKWGVKFGKEVAEEAVETAVKQGTKESVERVEKELAEREVREVEEGAAKHADDAPSKTEKKAKDKTGEETKPPEKPECIPRPVPHAGGNKAHNACADRVPPNIFPGKDVLVKGKKFDALSPMHVLWEVKTAKFSKYPKFLKDITIANDLVEGYREFAIATYCGFPFIFGVIEDEHLTALRAAGAIFPIQVFPFPC